MKTERALSEEAIQAGIVAFLRTVLPPSRYRIYAVPNGGARSKAEAGRMKATGTLAGVFDVCILGPGGQTWHIETKAAKGRLSDAQEEMRLFMVAAAVPHVVARGIDDVRAALQTWGIRTREVASTRRQDVAAPIVAAIENAGRTRRPVDETLSTGPLAGGPSA